MIFNDIVSYLEDKFKLPVEYELASNVLLLRIHGVDNVSIGRYIKKDFKNIKVTTKEIEGYKITVDGWVKIECGS